MFINKFFKYFFCFVLTFEITFSVFLLAQSGRDFQQGNSDYPVPEPIAAQALAGNTPAIMFPSSVRSLTFSLNSSWTGKEGVRTAGIEVAPFFIANTFNLSQYLSGRLIRVLYRTRISISSELFSDNAFRGALGFRWMLHDDADIRSDSLFQKILYQWGREIPEISNQCSDISEETSSYTSCITEGISHLKNYQASIDSLRDALKTLLWNRSVFELAFVSLYNSTGEKLTNQQYQAYFNFALPISTFGQSIVGLSGWVGHSYGLKEYQRRCSFIERLSFGNNSQRYFIETGLIAANKFKPDLRLAGGIYYGITNGLGLQFFAGISLLGRSWTGKELKINILFGTPEIRI